VLLVFHENVYANLMNKQRLTTKYCLFDCTNGNFIDYYEHWSRL